MQDITSHPYSAHSRRPAECRVCKSPAGWHAASEDSHRSLWKSLRNPLVTPRHEGYSERTLNVLRAIAGLGGKVDSWDMGNRGWHATAKRILINDGLIAQVNDGEVPARYELTETGVQVCAWHGIEITQTVEIVEVTPIDATTEETMALLSAVADTTPSGAVPVADLWKRAESEIWAATRTDVRTRPRGFRKVKNTRSARARRGGAR